MNDVIISNLIDRINQQQEQISFLSRLEFAKSAVTLSSGGIVFTNGAGLLLTDSSNLFWDDLNNRLGIDTNSPQAPLHLIPGAKEAIRLSSAAGRGSSLLSYGTGAGDALYLSGNLYFDGTNWRRMETGASGWLVALDANGDNFNIQRAASGANPVSAFTEFFKIASDGNVGIGCPPSSFGRLKARGVDGSASNYGLLIENSTPTTLLYIRNDGYSSIYGPLLVTPGRLHTGVDFGATVQLGSRGISSTNADYAIYADNSSGTVLFTARDDGDSYVYGPMRAEKGFQPPRSSGAALFGIDATVQGSQLSITNNGVSTVLGGTNNFSGILCVDDLGGGSLGVFALGGVGGVKMADTQNIFTVTFGTAGKINVAVDGSGITKIENKTGATVNLNVFAIRTRTTA